VSADPGAIGPDGTVRLRRYLLHENIWWLSVGCSGCGHLAPVGVRAAIEIMGSGEATVGQLARRLRCGACGGWRVLIQIAADTRSADLRRRDGPPPETRADPRRRG
jgi:hypothetical protein